MSHTLLISNFGPRMTERDLYYIAVEQGLAPGNVMFTTDEETGHFLGVAHMQFETDDQARHAAQTLHKFRFHDVTLHAELPRERPRRPGARPTPAGVENSFAGPSALMGTRPRYRDSDFRKKRNAFDDDDE